MKIPLKKQEGLDTKYVKTRATNTEKKFQMLMVYRYVLTLVTICAGLLLISFILITLFPDCTILNWPIYDYVNNMFCNLIVLSLVVMFLDTIVSGNREGRMKRDEARAILRQNRIIQPDIDMYLVRKNLAVTPKEKTVRKFQVKSDFVISDMKDMYSTSELVSDAGMSKIQRYAYYQNRLMEDFQKLSTSVDFAYYPEISDAVVKYMDATSYGQAALDAVLGYEDSKSGTRSTRTVIIGMIRDEPVSGSFGDASPMMKNVYLVCQMIKDQEEAIGQYLRLMKALSDSNPDQRKSKETIYE